MATTKNFSSLFFSCAISARISPSPCSCPPSKLNTLGMCLSSGYKSPFYHQSIYNYDHSLKGEKGEDTSSCLLGLLMLNRNPQGDSWLKGNAIFLSFLGTDNEGLIGIVDVFSTSGLSSIFHSDLCGLPLCFRCSPGVFYCEKVPDDCQFCPNTMLLTLTTAFT